MIKALGYLLIVASVIILTLQIRSLILSRYTYEKQFSSMWALADKSSTIPAKQQYITQFLTALKVGETNGVFADYNATWLKTPNNSFAANVKAIQTLSDRLTQIQDMDPASFQYNTAIQQITAQEQGEAHRMLAVFEGCYDRACYPIIWGWIGVILFTLSVVALFVGLMILAIGYESGNGSLYYLSSKAYA